MVKFDGKFTMLYKNLAMNWYLEIVTAERTFKKISESEAKKIIKESKNL
jgi:hypothetical protein